MKGGLEPNADDVATVSARAETKWQELLKDLVEEGFNFSLLILIIRRKDIELFTNP